MPINQGSTFAQPPVPGLRRHVYEFGPYCLDVLNQRLLRAGEPIPITPKTLDLLLLLVRNRERVLTKSELMQDLWPDTAVEEANLTQQVFTLRKILGEGVEASAYVETMPRRGYRFAADVREVVEPSNHAIGTVSGPGVAEIVRAPDPHARGWLPLAAVFVALVAAAFAVTRFWPANVGRERVMLAVLPFDNLTGDATQDFFSDGLTEEMIAELGRLHPRRLGVIARTSSMAYKGAGKPIAQIGRELGVDFILEGSLRQSQQSVRVTAQLIEVRDQTQRWSRDFDSEVRDVLSLQRAIAQDIRLQLTPEEQTRLKTSKRVDPRAYEEYLRGRFFWNKRTEEGLRQAIKRFEQAIAIDPGYALAHAALADCYGPMVYFGHAPPMDALAKGKPAALKALSLDDTLAEAHTSLGNFKGSFEWDWRGAEEELRRALDLNPSYATGHDWYAQYLVRVGRVEQALAEGTRARELDPLSLIINAGRANRLYFARRYDEAITQLRQTLDLDLRFATAQWYIGRTYTQAHRHQPAIDALEAAVRLEAANPQYLASLGFGYAAAGRRADALKVLGELQQLSLRRYVPPYSVATIYAGLGERDQAFHWLEKAYAERSPLLTFMRVEPALDRLRSDPRFDSLIRRVGLVAEGL